MTTVTVCNDREGEGGGFFSGWLDIAINLASDLRSGKGSDLAELAIVQLPGHHPGRQGRKERVFRWGRAVADEGGHGPRSKL